MDLFLSVLKWSLAAGLTALALCLLRPVLNRRYWARWRYWIWLFLSFALILGPGAYHLLAAQSAAAVPAMVIRTLQMSLQRQSDWETGSCPQILLALWLAGAALFLLWRLLGTLLFCRRARRWSRPPGGETRQIYQETCAALHIRHPPALLLSAPTGSPMTTGLLRPRLYLPSEDWAPQKLVFIFRHELTHFRRQDLWYKFLLLLANALHWFNPLIYLLSQEAEADLELICDDAVVADCGQEDRQAYSETLLGSVHRQRGLGRIVLSTHFYGGAKVMKDRFRNILDQNRRIFGAAQQGEPTQGELAE